MFGQMKVSSIFLFVQGRLRPVFAETTHGKTYIIQLGLRFWFEWYHYIHLSQYKYAEIETPFQSESRRFSQLYNVRSVGQVPEKKSVYIST